MWLYINRITQNDGKTPDSCSQIPAIALNDWAILPDGKLQSYAKWGLN